MVNEEKAKEIAGLCDGCLDVRKNLTCQFDCINVGLYCGALKMADWKDSQHKETIENYQKRIAELEEQIVRNTLIRYEDYIDLVDPDGSRMMVSKKEDIDNLSETITQFRKENNIQTM